MGCRIFLQHPIYQFDLCIMRPACYSNLKRRGVITNICTSRAEPLLRVVILPGHRDSPAARLEPDLQTARTLAVVVFQVDPCDLVSSLPF